MKRAIPSARSGLAFEGPRLLGKVIEAARFGALCCVLTFAALDGSSAAGSAAFAGSVADDEADDASLLAPGDRLSITVFDQPEISADYMVEAMGTITLPLIGPVNVTRFTPEALQDDLTTRFGNGYLQNPVISVRLSELRPLLIVGTVRSPGRYAFSEGMTAETAMAIAGGLTRLSGEAVTQRSDFLQTDERLKSLKLTYLSQRVRKARIEAQLANSTAVELPNAEPADADIVQRLIEGEREILTFQSTSQGRQVELLKEQSRQVEGDIQAFAEQSRLEQEQIDYIDDQVRDYKGLLAKGLTRKSTVIELQRERSKAMSDRSRVLSDLARSRSTLAEVQLKLAELDTSYRSRLMTDLQDIKLRIAELESGLPLVAEAQAMKLGQVSLDAEASRGTTSLRVSRFRRGHMDVFDVSPSTPLRPGDVLQVGTPSAGLGPAGGAGSPPPEPSRDREAPGVPVASTQERLSQR